MRTSESLSDFAPAFVKAQAEIESADKDRINPAFKSKYATLAACIEASRPALAKHGLSVLQGVRMATTGEPYVYVTTRILHASGEWIEEELAWPVKNMDSFGVGSGVTYARRVGYCGLVGVVADEDDDGAASVRQPQAQAQARPRPLMTTTSGSAAASTASPAEDVPAIMRGSELPPAKETLTPPEQHRLWAVARDSGWTAKEYEHFLRDEYHVASSREVSRADLQRIIDTIQAGREKATP